MIWNDLDGDKKGVCAAFFYFGVFSLKGWAYTRLSVGEGRRKPA
jgi:hypothetical protein